MDQEIQPAANVEGEVETPVVDSAPTEPTPEVDTTTSEKTETPVAPEPTDKTVPLRSLQEERERRKAVEQYNKQLEARLGIQRPAVAPQPRQPETESPDYDYVDIDSSDVMTRSEYEFVRREEKSWSDAEREFNKELEEFPMIKDLAEGLRQRKALSERTYLSPKEAVREIVTGLKQAQAKGQKAAQTSVQVQQIAQVEGKGSQNVSPDADRIATLRSQVGSTNRHVRDAALLELARLGKI